MPTRRCFLRLEALEDRLAPAGFGVANWVFQGPGPIVGSDGQTIMPDASVSGAINGLAINPTNPKQMYVATVNGGIWRTDNADMNNPTSIIWTPKTDQLGSLATAEIAFSPLDPTGKTLFATTGSWSSFGDGGGLPIGVLSTTDGGTTWTVTQLNPGDEPKGEDILPTSERVQATGKQLVLVASNKGLYASMDGGMTYLLQQSVPWASNPKASIDQLVADPNHPDVFYVGVRGFGVFKGQWNVNSNQMITWTDMNSGLNRAFDNSIKLTAQSYNGSTWLFAYLTGDGQTGTVYRLDPTAGNTKWTMLTTPPQGFAQNEGFGDLIVADPRNSNVIYLGGFGNGNLQRYVDTFPDGFKWTILSGVGPDGTSIHPDVRGLVFAASSNTLFALNDGGIFFLPISNPLQLVLKDFADWGSFNGSLTGTGLGITELHNVAYDSNSHIIFGGSQDNGTEMQQTQGSLFWKYMNGGDGNSVMVDNFTLGAKSQSIRYSSTAGFDQFKAQTFDALNNLVKEVSLKAGVPSAFKGGFITPNAIDAIAPTASQLAAGKSTRIVIGGHDNNGNGLLYEADNAGTAANAMAVNWTQVTTAAAMTAWTTPMFSMPWTLPTFTCAPSPAAP
jgi:hypothetical protein